MSVEYWVSRSSRPLVFTHDTVTKLDYTVTVLYDEED